MDRVYMCIDLKSFYASVECRERNLNPITTNLVVADNSRTEKTICLAVSPSLKSYGLPGRARLFEVVQKIKKVNYDRRRTINYRKFKGKSYDIEKLNKDKYLELDFVIATPRMKLYMEYSTRIYNVYLKYLSEDDIHVYSIDEVFCDVTNYLKHYKMTAERLAIKIIQDVYKETGITATCGIGTNLFLAKVAMDIGAKHISPNKYGVRVAYLDEMTYRKKLWHHTPITDFWRVGRGYSKRLEKYGIKTMGDVARCSINNENLLYKLFGVNAELLIDHAWGVEPTTISDIKKFKPKANCLTSGQVLQCPYSFEKTRLVVKEMIELLTLDLVDKHLVTDNIVLTVGYDIENLKNKDIKSKYNGEIIKDSYGRLIPKSAHGTARTNHKTSSTKIITNQVLELFDRIVNPILLVKRINIAFCNVVSEEKVESEVIYEQFDLFSDSENLDNKRKQERVDEKNEKKVQKVVIDIKKKYGKNAILKGMNLVDGATTKSRNNQVGGHKV